MKTEILNTITASLAGAFGVVVDAADLYVPADYATVQGAVDAANSGDTIHIAGGVYVEQITVMQKDLTLIGQPGTILRAAPNMAPGGGGVTQWRPIVFIFQSFDVVLRDLAFEGDQLADQQVHGLVGVAYYDSGGTVEDCRFTGFRENVPGSNVAAALRFLNDLPGASLLDVRAAGNVIEDSYLGIELAGAPDKISYNFTIENNIIRGVGPTATIDELNRQGLRLREGATGSVTGNSISGYSYDGEGAPYPYAWGILAMGTAEEISGTTPLDFMRFENNTLQDNNQHMTLVRARSLEIVKNHFEGSGPGRRPSGLWFTGENVQVRQNVFRDMEEGIRVGGTDPDFGTDLGVATNAMLIDNRFCEVTTPINTQPQATAAEQGSLTCPFPDPVLDITKSVLLSWPEIEEGFVLESAPTTTGPWTPVEATYFLQDSNHSIAVPTDQDQLHFRLAKP